MGCDEARTREYMCGSAMRLMGTGMPISHARMDLSSEEVIMRRLESTNVIARERLG